MAPRSELVAVFASRSLSSARCTSAGARVPAVLARMAQRSDLAPFSYGLVCCPGDGTQAAKLVQQALERLREARTATGSPRAAIRAEGAV